MYISSNLTYLLQFLWSLNIWHIIFCYIYQLFYRLFVTSHGVRFLCSTQTPRLLPNCKCLIQYVYSIAIRGGTHSQAIMPDQSHISHSVGPERKRGRNRNAGKTFEATSRCMSSRAGIGGLYTYIHTYECVPMVLLINYARVLFCFVCAWHCIQMC